MLVTSNHCLLLAYWGVGCRNFLVSHSPSKARAGPGTGRSMGLSGKEVQALKELEELTVAEAKALWQEHGSKREFLVSEGYLVGEDLTKTETWMRQRIFAHVLEKKSKTGEGWLRELISGFKLSSRVPPLPGIVITAKALSLNSSKLRLQPTKFPQPDPCQASRGTRKKMITTRSSRLSRPCAKVPASTSVLLYWGSEELQIVSLRLSLFQLQLQQIMGLPFWLSKATSQAFSQGLRQGFMSSKPGGQQGYGALDLSRG